MGWRLSHQPGGPLSSAGSHDRGPAVLTEFRGGAGVSKGERGVLCVAVVARSFAAFGSSVAIVLGPG